MKISFKTWTYTAKRPAVRTGPLGRSGTVLLGCRSSKTKASADGHKSKHKVGELHDECGRSLVVRSFVDFIDRIIGLMRMIKERLLERQHLLYSRDLEGILAKATVPCLGRTPYHLVEKKPYCQSFPFTVPFLPFHRALDVGTAYMWNSRIE